MKRHLKASLGLGNFNGSGFGARQPTNNHVVREENGAPITTNGNGQSEQSNLDGARGKDANKDDTAERMPRKDTRGESNGREDGILVSADAHLDAAHGREPRKSAENGVSEKNANGNREMSAGYGNHRKETVDRFAKMNLGKESDGANSQQSTDVNSLESVKPKDRRGRPPGQHTPAKKPRQGAALRGGESPDEGDGSDEIETAETSSTNFEPLTPEYYPGDLLWSKIGRASFWPCMVIQDPINNKYCEHKNGHFKYYVQYFGHQVVHGWTQNPNRVIPYRGIEAFKEFAAERIAEVKSRQKFYALGPKNQTRQAKENWKQALREIKTAAAYELPQRRYKKFRFAFYPGGKKRTNEASAPPEAEAAPPEPAPEPRLPPTESPESSPNSKPNPPPKVRAKASEKSERDKDVGLEGEDFNNNLGE